ncbi:MAG: hypothetical protein ACFNLN_02420, partial [Treponema socranskii subsp. buccale]
AFNVSGAAAHKERRRGGGALHLRAVCVLMCGSPPKCRRSAAGARFKDLRARSSVRIVHARELVRKAAKPAGVLQYE